MTTIVNLRHTRRMSNLQDLLNSNFNLQMFADLTVKVTDTVYTVTLIA